MTHSPTIIPLFLPPQSCAFRCIFCNREATSSRPIVLSSISESIRHFLNNLPARQPGNVRQLAFYGGSFTAMPEEVQRSYLKEAQPFLDSRTIDSIRISTRPDALEEDTLRMLKEYGVATVELGAQSLDDEVLALSNRGHTRRDVLSAISRLRKGGFQVGIHVMIGLPGDSEDRFLETLRLLALERPDFVRIHPTLVLRGSILEALWRSKQYAPLSLDEAITWLKKGLLFLEMEGICISRIGLQPTPELEDHYLAGPYHPAIRHRVEASIAFDMACLLLRSSGCRSATFLCNPKDVSVIGGYRNQNIRELKRLFRLSEVNIKADSSLPRGSLVLKNGGKTLMLHRLEMARLRLFSGGNADSGGLSK